MRWPAILYVIAHVHGPHGLHAVRRIHSGKQLVTAGGVPELHKDQAFCIVHGKQGRAHGHVLCGGCCGRHGQGCGQRGIVAGLDLGVLGGLGISQQFGEGPGRAPGVSI